MLTKAIVVIIANMFICQIIVFHTLNSYNVIGQLYLNKTGVGEICPVRNQKPHLSLANDSRLCHHIISLLPSSTSEAQPRCLLKSSILSLSPRVLLPGRPHSFLLAPFTLQNVHQISASQNILPAPPKSPLLSHSLSEHHCFPSPALARVY